MAHITATHGAEDIFPITPHNTTKVRELRAVYVTVAGDLAYISPKGTESIIPVDRFQIWPMIGDWVIKATGTTATVYGVR